MVQLSSVLSKFYEEYQNNTPKKLKIIDAYLVYILLTGIMQFVYCLLVGTFPFNSFLSGFISCVSCFVLAGKMRFEVKLEDFLLIFCIFESFSLLASAVESTKQTSIHWNLAGKRICRFHFCSHRTPPRRRQLYRLNWTVSEMMTTMSRFC